MSGAAWENIAGVAAAIAVSVGGVIYIWTHAAGRSYDPDELITIAEFSTGSDARLWKMRLESQGVQCIVSGDVPYTRASMLPYSDLSAIRLQVLGRDVGRARAILGRR